MLHFQVDPTTGLPAYRQIMDQVRNYLAGGLLKEGDALPSIRQMAQTLRLNPATVVKAYAELQHGGVVEMRHGKGVFVAETTPELSRREREAALRRAARMFADEVLRCGIGPEEALRIVGEEMRKAVPVADVPQG